jgi:diguanylate cyclase (GGDEF)-like protein
MIIEQSYLVHQEEELRVTLSIGATLVDDNDTLESLVKRADSLMYDSKHSGRNRVTVG